MTSKVVKTLIILVVLAIPLLMGNVLLTRAEQIQTTDSKADSTCCMQLKQCSQKVQSCCQARKQANPFTTSYIKECCDAKNEEGTCPAVNCEKPCQSVCQKTQSSKEQKTNPCSSGYKKSCCEQ